LVLEPIAHKACDLKQDRCAVCMVNSAKIVIHVYVGFV